MASPTGHDIKHYESDRRNISPKIWGNCMWRALFCIADGYPEHPSIDDQHHYKRFFYHLQHVIPCNNCRANFREKLKNMPINDKNYDSLQTRSMLVGWVLNLHNDVNISQGKPTIGMREARERFIENGHQSTVIEAFMNNDVDKTIDDNRWIVLLVIAVVIGVIIYNK